MGRACMWEEHRCCAARAALCLSAMVVAAGKQDWCLLGGKKSQGWLLPVAPQLSQKGLSKLGVPPLPIQEQSLILLLASRLGAATRSLQAVLPVRGLEHLKLLRAPSLLG